jgi:flagellar FliJ protein
MAKKFNFKYNSILKLRTEKVNQAQELLFQAERIKIEKQKIITEYKNYINGLLNNNTNKNKISELQNIAYHKQFINSEIEKLEKEKVQIDEIISLRRNKLNEAMKDEKVLEKLKEKKLNSYKEELNKEETKFLDEISMKKVNKIS